MNTHLKVSDLAAAFAPALAKLTLSEINSFSGIIGTLLGTAYLVWKWRREAAK